MEPLQGNVTLENDSYHQFTLINLNILSETLSDTLRCVVNFRTSIIIRNDYSLAITTHILVTSCVAS